MKRIIIPIILMIISSTALAQSQWFPLSSSMFVMRSMKNEKVLLSAGIDTRTNDVTFRILDLSGSLCKAGVTSDAEVFPAMKINGKYVRVLSMCINGSQLIAPETTDGNRYFKDQIESGNLVTIETNMGPILSFKGAPPTDLRTKLLTSKNAM